MVVFQKLVCRISEMKNSTYWILKYSLLLSCGFLLLSIALLAVGEGLSIRHYQAYLWAKELAGQPAAILMVAVIGSACIEEIGTGGGG